MKKLLFAVLMTCVLLVGCGSSKEEMEKAVAVNTDDLYTTVSALTETKMVKLNDSLIENYYGIPTADLEEYVFAQSEDPTSAETIIMVRAKDGVDLSKYEENINNVIAQKTDEMNNYNEPEQVELLEKANVKFSENGFYVVVADKSDVIAETIEKGLGL